MHSCPDTQLGDLDDCVKRFFGIWGTWLKKEKKRRAKQINIFFTPHLMQNVLRWCDPAAAFQKSICHERGTIAPCPNISVDREKVGVVYYWTGWCIDPPGSGPDFGGLAALLSSLSFPQHQSRWLQLPTDQRCNGLASRGKARARLWPQNTTCGGSRGFLLSSGANRPPGCCNVRFTERVDSEFVSC